MKAAWWALCLTALALSGCADDAPEPVAAVPDSEMLHISGTVLDAAVTPIPGATVQILESDLSTTTDAQGTFRFDPLPVGIFVVRATAPDHAAATLTAGPVDGDLVFTLEQTASRPYQSTQTFHGIWQCAAEYVIITPNCDEWVRFVDPSLSPLDGENEFDLELERGWKTLVVDVVFDAADHPAIDGLRTTLAASDDPNELTSYQQYGRFQGPESYTFRVEPGQSYDDGVAPMPENATALRLNVYPQSIGWHATCAAACFLGVGAAVDLEFDLYVTAFYVEPAPDGWSFAL